MKDSNESLAASHILVIEKKNCRITQKSNASDLTLLACSSDDEKLGLQNPICGLLGILNIQG